MQKLSFILRYLKYIYKSKTKFDVHPPFLFDLITKVFESRSNYTIYAKIENLKKELLNNDTSIEVLDLGAGSKVSKGSQRMLKEIAKCSSKPAKYGRLLYKLVNHFKPEIILELGTSLGLSTAYMAAANQKAKVITIEGCPNISKLARKNMNALMLGNVEFINDNFDISLPKVLNSIDQLDFAFIDGNHKKDPTINYFEQCLPKVVNDSILVFDDIHWSEGMEAAWKIIKDHPNVSLTIDLFYMGIVFFKKELTKQHFIIKY